MYYPSGERVLIPWKSTKIKWIDIQNDLSQVDNITRFLHQFVRIIQNIRIYVTKFKSTVNHADATFSNYNYRKNDSKRCYEKINEPFTALICLIHQFWGFLFTAFSQITQLMKRNEKKIIEKLVKFHPIRNNYIYYTLDL